MVELSSSDKALQLDGCQDSAGLNRVVRASKTVASADTRKSSRHASGFDAEYVVNVLLAAPLIVLFLPLMVVVAALVMLQDGGPALFGHRRIGRGGQSFACLKFRSMKPDANGYLKAHFETNPEARREWERDFKLRSDPRVTPLGRFLRKSSLDELPQLFNVLRGEMSLVGPRPIVQAEAVRYGRYFRDYCSVRPGITGLWQISGRNNVDYRRRIAMDLVYTREKSLLGDIKILIMTVPAVFLRHGAH